jgi:TPR repeat protein
LKDLEAAKAAFEEAASGGHPEAQMGVGFLYATG